MKEDCRTMAGVRMTLASLPSPGLAAAAAAAPGPRRVGRRDKKKKNNREKTRGNNDRVPIASNSIYTITHSIRGPQQKNSGLSFDVGVGSVSNTCFKSLCFFPPLFLSGEKAFPRAPNYTPRLQIAQRAREEWGSCVCACGVVTGSKGLRGLVSRSKRRGRARARVSGGH